MTPAFRVSIIDSDPLVQAGGRLGPLDVHYNPHYYSSFSSRVTSPHIVKRVKIMRLRAIFARTGPADPNSLLSLTWWSCGSP